METLQFKNWTNFSKGGDKFVHKYCRHELKVQKWIRRARLRICTMPSHEDFGISWQLNTNGMWEPETNAFLFLKVFSHYPQAAFIDIGAHLGTFSLSAAKLDHDVFAFEPNPVTVPYLAASISVNGLTHKVTLYPVALMDQHYCVINHTPIDAGTNAVIKKECADKNSTPTATLDDLLPIFRQRNIHQAVIKIDVEASEARVILGGLNFLQNIDVPIIVMEYNWIREDLTKGKDSEKRKLITKFLSKMEEMNYYATEMTKDKMLPFETSHSWPDYITWHKK